MPPAELEQPLVDNFVGTWRLLVHDHELVDDDGLIGVRTGLDTMFLNAVLATDWTPPEANERVAATLERFSGLPFVWWILPGARPPDIGQRLEQHGLTRRDDWAGMAMELTSPPQAPELAGVSLRPVTDEADLEAALAIVAPALELPAAFVSRFRSVVLESGLAPDAPIRVFLGDLDGEPVATAALISAANVAGIYNVATAPNARRRGIGAAVTLAALEEGYRRGHRVAALQASALGHGVYAAIGFVDCCKLARYRPAGQSSYS